MLHNGLGQYEAALRAARSAGERDELMASVWSLPELVEAATRCGEGELAAAALERLVARTRAAGTEFALGLEVRIVHSVHLVQIRGRIGRSGRVGRI